MTSTASQRIRRHYDVYPFPGELNSYGPWVDLAPGLLRQLQLELDAARDADVLDAGCGTGEFARSFARLGANVLAIDLSEGALAKARDNDALAGVTGVDYRQTDILSLSLDQTFDFVLALGVLHHTANPAQGFVNLSSRVRPGGYLAAGLYSSVSRVHIFALRRLLSFLARGNQEKAIDIASRWFKPILPLFVGRKAAADRSRVADLLANPHELPISLHTALGWFEKAGFEVVSCTPSHRPADYGRFVRLFAKAGQRSALLAIQWRWLLWNADYFVVYARRPL